MAAPDDSSPLITRRDLLQVAAGVACTSSAQARPVSRGSWSKIDEIANKVISDKLTPGLAVSVTRAAEFVYSKAFGLANIETDTKVTTRQIFRIGSITKQFTGAAIALLAEDGALVLDDKLARFLPEFPRAQDITLRQILTHTSGLGNYTNLGSSQAFLQAARPDYDNAALLNALASSKPLFVAEPGTMFSYSNSGYVLLGLVVEKASGEPYGQYYKRRLFEPAMMGDTAVDNASDVVRGRVAGYTPNPAAPPGFENASFISMTFPGGAGSIRSTSEDLCRWHAALLGGQLLRPESLREMLSPGRLQDGTLPMAASGSATNGEKKTVEYGFGLGMGAANGRRFVGHSGGINGFLSQIRSFPADKISFVWLVNTDAFGKSELVPTLDTLRDAAVEVVLGLG
jgi:D-alanyl-D-alanine carboxypeptidase